VKDGLLKTTANKKNNTYAAGDFSVHRMRQSCESRGGPMILRMGIQKFRRVEKFFLDSYSTDSWYVI
jgi:hypothetical protein